MGQRPDVRRVVAVPTGAPRLPAADVDGCDLYGRPKTVRLTAPGRWSLLLFLGSHCDGCLPFWASPQAPEEVGLEQEDTVVLVTRGPLHERAEAVGELAGAAGLEEPSGPIMSDTAWATFGVLGAPFFVLIDGVEVATEGVAWSVEQVAADVRRARRRSAGPAEPQFAGPAGPQSAGPAGPRSSVGDDPGEAEEGPRVRR